MAAVPQYLFDAIVNSGIVYNGKDHLLRIESEKSFDIFIGPDMVLRLELIQ